jgi:hypothetical protein
MWKSLLLITAFVLLPLNCSHAEEGLLQAALKNAGDNRAQLEKALSEAPQDQQAGIRFLIENMPVSDLQTLSADFLLENSRLTWQALRESAWADRIPQDVIFDSLLPYANINERRDAWRKEFFEKFRPLVKDAKSPSEAAAVLNQQVFPMVNVKYSTQRKKADQSPLESMESGLASCTGLSVLLVDACRAVGVPARIVGTPLWSDNSGNHTWVEIWDNGWHFTGACEPTGNALDQGWFIDRASKAIRDERRHAIYAVTFRKNGQNFPMVWARDNTDVFAVNVTDRYTALRSPIPQNHSALRVRVIGPTGARVAVDVRMLDANGNELFRGKSKDDRFDSNDHLTAAVPTGTKVTVSIADTEISQQVEVLEQEQLVELRQP